MAEIKPETRSGPEANVKKVNVQKKPRRKPVGGCVYTDGMSDAYWRGREDGKTTATRMINKAEPKNVRVHALAVKTGGQEEGVIPAQTVELTEFTAPESVEIAPVEETAAQVVAVQEDTSAEMAVVMNNTENKLAETGSTGESTYSLRKGEIISGNVRAVNPVYKVEGSGNQPPKFFTLSNQPAQKQKPAPKPADDGRFIQRWADISFFRKAIMALSALTFLFAFSPLLVGVTTIGILPIALIGVFFFAVALFWNRIEGCRNKAVNALFALVALSVVLGIVCMAFVSGKMLGASMRTVPEEKTRVTVVVLGCLIRGDQPSLMLQNRLDTAAEYLRSNPEAYCVVTGGQGDNEDYAEATIMKKYLVAAGISPSRIIAERKSTSTVENIRFAKALIEKYNCHEDIVIVSDRFHQYRAYLAAKDEGLRSYAMPCETRWELAAQYWFREMVGIYMIWFGADGA